jgi:hypothetical protein
MINLVMNESDVCVYESSLSVYMCMGGSVVTKPSLMSDRLDGWMFYVCRPTLETLMIKLMYSNAPSSAGSNSSSCIRSDSQ